jgi:hypothetical protein
MSRKYVYVLRSDRPDGRSYGGFLWPALGPVEAPDWNDRAECGGGLHGLLWGCGSADLLFNPRAPETRWRVVKVLAADVVDLGGKVKFPRGEVVYCGDRGGALALLDKKGAADKPVVFASRAGGDRSTVAGGDESTVTGGDWSTVAGGYESTVTGGYRSTVTGGDGSVIQIKRWDSYADRCRIVIGYIGEDGLLPNTPYRLDAEGRFVAVTS